MFAAKNHQGGLEDKEDESRGKMLERPGSERCPVRLIEKYLSHLNPECSGLFQNPRSACNFFDPAKDALVPLVTTRSKTCYITWSSRNGIKPHLKKPFNQGDHRHGFILC